MSKSRILVLVALSAMAVGALIAVQAFAATTTWSGRGDNDHAFKVSFKRVGGQPVKVKDFATKQLFFNCSSNGPPDFRADTTIHTPITVHSGSFSRTSSFTSGSTKVSYTITGKFASGTKATGTYKERRSLISDPSVHCDSAKQPWTTHKQ